MYKCLCKKQVTIEAQEPPACMQLHPPCITLTACEMNEMTNHFLPCQAELEPPWVDNCSMDLGKWGKVVDSFRKLALRSAALESLLEVRRIVYYYNGYIAFMAFGKFANDGLLLRVIAF